MAQGLGIQTKACAVHMSSRRPQGRVYKEGRPQNHPGTPPSVLRVRHVSHHTSEKGAGFTDVGKGTLYLRPHAHITSSSAAIAAPMLAHTPESEAGIM